MHSVPVADWTVVGLAGWLLQKDSNFRNTIIFIKPIEGTSGVILKKPLKCQICNYRCSQKGTLKRHVAFIHEGKKPVKFKTSSILKGDLK